jgi:hypothetical protein
LPNVLSLSPKLTKYVETNQEPNYLSRRIFNAVANGESDYTYKVEGSTEVYNPSSNNYFPFTMLTVKDSFYVQTSFDEGLAPFFPDSLKGQPVDTVFALLSLKYQFASGRTDDFIRPIIIFRYGDSVQGFVGGGFAYYDGTDWAAFWNEKEIVFSSDYYLAGNHLITELDEVSTIYRFNLTTGSDGHDITFAATVQHGTYGADRHSIPCSIDLNSLRRDEVPGLVKTVTENGPKKINVTTSVIETDPNDLRRFYVEVETLPSLKSVFSQFFKVGEYIYSAGDVDLKKGDSISFAYYVRFEGYAPIELNLGMVEIL